MKPIFPNPQMQSGWMQLLFCFEKEIIERDLVYSELNENQDTYEHKYIWFNLWKSITNQILEQVTKSKELAIDSLDKYVLCNNLKKRNTQSKTNWEKSLYRQCMNFLPYSWKSLEDSDKCEDDAYYKRVSPELRINSKIKNGSLKDIATFLHYYNIRRIK